MMRDRKYNHQMKQNPNDCKISRKSPPSPHRLIAPASLLLILILLFTACQPQNDSFKRVQDVGVLRVGLDPTYPPFDVADANGVYGFDVDLANELAEELGVQTEFVLFGYDGLYDALATKQVDVLISALVITPEKTRDFACSEPYFNAGEFLIVPLEEINISEMADLNGRILAVELGALGHVEATTWAKSVPNLTVVPYPTGDEALTAVATGAADAVLIDAISGRLFLKDNPNLKTIQPSITVEPFAIVVRIEDQQLLNEINNSMANLQENAQLNTITEKWLSP